jgi:hypothetical protein
MVLRNQNCGVREALHGHPLVHNGLLKQISIAVNVHTTVGPHERYVEPLRPELDSRIMLTHQSGV